MGTPDYSGLSRPRGGCSRSPLLVVGDRNQNSSDSFGNANGVCNSFRGEGDTQRTECKNVMGRGGGGHKGAENRLKLCNDAYGKHVFTRFSSTD